MSSLAVPCFARIWSSCLSVSGVSLVMVLIAVVVSASAPIARSTCASAARLFDRMSAFLQ